MISKLHKTIFRGKTIGAFLIVEGDLVVVQLDNDSYPLSITVDKFNFGQYLSESEGHSENSIEAEKLYFDSFVVELYDLSLLLVDTSKSKAILDKYNEQISALGHQFISLEKYKVIRNKIGFIRGVTDEERNVLSESIKEANRFSREFEKSILSLIFTDGSRVFHQSLFSQFSRFIDC